MRLCSGAAIFMGLGGTYALWSSVAIWMVGALAAFIAGALVYAGTNRALSSTKALLKRRQPDCANPTQDQQTYMGAVSRNACAAF